MDFLEFNRKSLLTPRQVRYLPLHLLDELPLTMGGHTFLSTWKSNSALQCTKSNASERSTGESSSSELHLSFLFPLLGRHRL